MIKASIVIPAFNAQKTIRACLEALEHQTVSRSEFEVIVIDDGSKDQTPEIVLEFKNALLFRQKNAGPAMARNRGAKKASAEIIVFLDSDCVPNSNWLEEMLKPFQKTEIAGAQGAYENPLPNWVACFIQLEIEERYQRMKKKPFIDFVGSYSAAYRKKIFLGEGCFDEAFAMASGEDTDFSFRLAKKGYKMVFASKAIVKHFHPTRLSKYWRTKFYRAYWRVRLYAKNPEKIRQDSYTNPFIKYQMGFMALFLAAIVAATIGLLAKQPGITLSFGWVAIAAFLASFFLSFQAAGFIFRKNRALGMIAPFLLTINAFLFVAGYSYGMVRLGKSA